jgi:hypothetical protein
MACAGVLTDMPAQAAIFRLRPELLSRVETHNVGPFGSVPIRSPRHGGCECAGDLPLGEGLPREAVGRLLAQPLGEQSAQMGLSGPSAGLRMAPSLSAPRWRGRVIPQRAQELRRIPKRRLVVLHLAGPDQGGEVRAHEHALGVGGRGLAICNQVSSQLFHPRDLSNAFRSLPPSLRRIGQALGLILSRKQWRASPYRRGIALEIQPPRRCTVPRTTIFTTSTTAHRFPG